MRSNEMALQHSACAKFVYVMTFSTQQLYDPPRNPSGFAWRLALSSAQSELHDVLFAQLLSAMQLLLQFTILLACILHGHGLL